MKITIIELTKTFGNTKVLDIPELVIQPGELVGIAGNNGAGKTTLFRLMLDLLETSSGYVELNGEKVNDSRGWKTKTGSFLDEGFLIGFLTPMEYLLFNASTYGISEEETNERLKEYTGLMAGELPGSGKYIRDLSTGNKQKTGIIAAMLSDPALLILDEPFNFLDPSSQINIRNLLHEKNKALGSTMLISSHNINHLAAICNRIILLEKGKIIMDVATRDEGKLKQIDDYFSVKAT